jgi:type III secretion protein Q
MTSRLKILNSASAKVVDDVCQDLPVIHAPSSALLRRVTGLWGPVLQAHDLGAAAVEMFQKYCKVKTIQPPVLIQKKGEPPASETRVTASPFTVGRKRENHLVLAEVGVSGLHAQLQFTDRWEILDLGSVNGTAVNGKWLEKNIPQALKSGDVITIMSTDVLFKIPDPVIGPPQVSLVFVGLETPDRLPPAGTLADALVGVAGSPHMIHLLAPSSLVRVWLESLVGTHFGGEVLGQPLSDVERGLYEFLLLKFIQTAHRNLLPGQAEGLYLAGVESPPAACLPVAGTAVARFLFRFQDRQGELRVLIPEAALESWTERLAPAGMGAPPGDDYWRRLAEPWNWLATPAAVMLGGVEFTLPELLSLEPGDVILLPPGGPAGNPDEGLNGLVRLCFHSECAIRGHAQLAPKDGAYQLTLKEFVFETTEEPMPQNPPTKTGTEPAPEPAAAKPGAPGELVKDLTVTLAVELDRIPLSLEELLRLSPGQVLQLEKTPGDPVDLCVDGRNVGRGQLVRINNELGVKILSIKK